MNNQAAVLIVEDLTRCYEGGAVIALDRVSFATDAARVVALTGPSGCGKSTLLSLIGLLDRPTRGRVVIGGQDLAGVRRPAAFRARMVGFVFQFHHLIPTMTLLENVAAPLIALGVARGERNEIAMTMLEQVGMAGRAGFLPPKLSGGERQRGAVARALVTRPPLVLADEPTGNLDTRSGRIVVELLVGHARPQGALVIIASHNPEIAAAADLSIVLRDGALVADQRQATGRLIGAVVSNGCCT